MRRRRFSPPARPAHKTVTVDHALADALGPEIEQPERRPRSEPILEAWPEGYRNGAFRLEGRDVVISARGKPDLRIENAL